MGHNHAANSTLDRAADRDNLPERGSSEASDAF